MRCGTLDMAISGVGSAAEKVEFSSGAWCSQRQGDVAGTGDPVFRGGGPS